MKILRQLNRARWKAFVDESPCGNIFHRPEMFDVFSRAKGHQPSLWAVAQDDGSILALLPVVRLTLLDGLLRRLTTRAVAYGGILCRPDEQGRAALGLLLDTYTREAGEGALFTEFRHMSDARELETVLGQHGFVHEDHLNFMIDLTLPQGALWRNISKRKREGIKSSYGKGITIQQVTSEQELDVAYQFLKGVYTRVQVPLADISLFKAAFEVLTPQDMFQVLLARVGESYVATLFLLTYHGTILYWYVGADRSFSAFSPGELLVWHTLQWGKEHGFQTFDFGGGGKPDQYYGPREFKSRFGGVQVNYGRDRCVHAPMRLKLSEVGYQFYRRVAS